jgi:hypothetical protein
MVGWVGQVAAQDTDGDGLTDFEEVSRVRTVPFGPQQVITTDLHASTLWAVDLDGDGDFDVLAAGSNKTFWFENRLNEASADFGPLQLLGTSHTSVNSVYAADLDGDGDPDPLSIDANHYDNLDKVAWYENRLNEASADFGPLQVITRDADDGRSVRAADLDGDGDPDVLSASSSPRYGKLAWYENRLSETSADFGPQQVITTSAYDARGVFAADLDGDGDPDVVSHSIFDDRVVWFENRLNEASADFGPLQVITTAASIVTSTFVTDLDGDGDSDVLLSQDGTIIAWYENRLSETSADFGPQQVITTSAASAWVFAADLDGDGDQDVLSLSWGGEIPSGRKVAWYENRLGEASADFGPEQVIASAYQPILLFAEDLDGDGDPDVLSGGGVEDRIVWYENPGTDPLDFDSDDDEISDGDELNLHGTDPINPDSDGDRFKDGAELRRGSDPTDPNSTPSSPLWRGFMLYKGSLKLHVRGTRYCYWGCVTNYLRRPLGGPLVGSGSANATLNITNSPYSFTLPNGGLYLETPSLARTLPPVHNGTASIQVRSHPNTSFANDSGFFGPGGGPGSHSFAYNQTTIMSGYYGDPRWRITPGANQFGGTLRLLGAIDEMRNLRLTGSGTVDYYAHAPEPFSALGGRCTATTGCPSLPVSQGSRIVQYYTSLKNLYTTALVNAWGYAWTTGKVYIRANDGAYLDTGFTQSGYDNRTPLGQGFIQLVSPHIAHWNFASLPLDRTTGAIAILNIEIRFVPEPKGWLMLVGGIGLLSVVYRRRARGLRRASRC